MALSTMAPQEGGGALLYTTWSPRAIRPPGGERVTGRRAGTAPAWALGAGLAGAKALFGEAFLAAPGPGGKGLRRWGTVNKEAAKAHSQHSHHHGRHGDVAGSTERISTVAGVASIVGGVSVIGSMAVGSCTTMARKQSMSEQKVRKPGRKGTKGSAMAVPEPAYTDMIDKRTAPALLVLLAVLYGGNVPLLKSIEDIAPLSLTAPELLALRFFMAFILILPWVVMNAGRLRAALRPSLELSVWLWSGYLLQVFALEKTSASCTSVGLATTGVFVQLLERFVDQRPFSKEVALFSVGTLVGVGFFVTAPGGPYEQEPWRPLVDRNLNFFPILAPQKMPHAVVLEQVPGEVIALLAAFFFAGHVWRSNKIVVQAVKRDVRGPLSQDEYCLALAALQCLWVMLLCIVSSLIDAPPTLSLAEQVADLKSLNFAMWMQIAACGMLCTGVPAVMELFAFKVVDPAIASLIYSTIPLWGTLLGVVFLHDAFGPQSICAGVIILVCSLGPSAMEILCEKKKPKDDKEDGTDEAYA